MDNFFKDMKKANRLNEEEMNMVSGGIAANFRAVDDGTNEEIPNEKPMVDKDFLGGGD